MFGMSQSSKYFDRLRPQYYFPKFMGMGTDRSSQNIKEHFYSMPKLSTGATENALN